MQENRSFLYGDSLFETIKVAANIPLLLDFHHQRLSLGLQALGFAPISFADFEQKIRAHIQAQHHANLRVRICFFRQGAGAYLPDEDCQTLCHIQSAPLPSAHYPLTTKLLHIGICPHIRITTDALSSFKTGSALRYVAAAQYAREQGWADALLLNSQERLAEATASNVFIVVNDRLLTPPLSEGCVAGVMRRHLLENLSLSQIGLSLQEQVLHITDLAHADEIWLSNAIRGVQAVQTLALPQGKAAHYTQTKYSQLLTHFFE